MCDLCRFWINGCRKCTAKPRRAMSYLRLQRVLVLICLVGLVSVLNSVFIVHEYRQTYKNVSTRAEDPIKPWNISRQILHVKEPTKEKKLGGFKFAEHVWNQCYNNKTVPSKLSPGVTVFSKYKTSDESVQLCGIWKVATTFLKRLFMIKNNEKYRGIHNPYDIPFNVMYSTPGASKIMNFKRNNTEKFLFVRNPYLRVYSAYIDKILAPNPVFWKYIAVPAIGLLRKNASPVSARCGHDLSFQEFVDYIIMSLKRKVKFKGKLIDVDGHVDIMNKMCKPCEVNYTFIGKMETFPEDSMVLVKKLGLEKTQQILAEHGAVLAADDALSDTVYQPFDPEFKTGYKGCISKRTALERAWVKLQARGLIGRQELNITDAQADKLTHGEFKQIAIDARGRSNSKERKGLKNEYFNSMFDTISLEKLEELRQLYAMDFKLFDYDDRPNWLFSRKRRKS